jgi:hypothetical protein
MTTTPSPKTAAAAATTTTKTQANIFKVQIIQNKYFLIWL